MLQFPPWRVFQSARGRILALTISGILLAVLLARSLPGLLQGRGGVRPVLAPVLLVTLDTTRADRLGCYGFRLARTPHIDRLAAEGVRCTSAAAVSPITLPSHASIFTGLYPPAHGVRDNGAYALGDEAVTLAERLRDAGYRTQAFVSALVLNRRYNLTQGFDGYDDDLWSEDEPTLFMIRDRPAQRTAERAVAWLERWHREEPERPFFLWVHFFDPHHPWRVEGPELLRAASPYDAEITVADRGVGSILEALERLGVLDETLVVLTADHGESLGEHGEQTHGVFVYESTIHIPLLLRYPPLLPAGRAYEGPVSQVDILPTVLGALGLPGARETQGYDLMPALRGKAPPVGSTLYFESLLSEVGFGMAPLYGVRQGGHKWIRAPRPELYALKSDPRERNNLYPAQRELGARLDHELQEILDESAARSVAVQSNPMDSETEEMLMALGYLAAAGERQSMEGMDPKDGIVLYEKMQHARHRAQGGDWDEAQRLLREVLEVTPRNVAAQNLLGYITLQGGDPHQARDHYLRSLAEDPRQSRVYGSLGAIALMLGELDEAERNFHRAVELTPAFVEALTNLGFVEILRGRNEAAQRWYERAIEADTGFGRVHRRLADLYYEQEAYPEAYAHYRKAVEAAASDLHALVQAGNSVRRLGRLDEAAGYYERAAQLRPDAWVPIYNLACLRALQGQPEQALRLLEQALERGCRSRRLLELDPDLESLRQRPGFAELLARLPADVPEPENTEAE
jgi:choline-sulfatase